MNVAVEGKNIDITAGESILCALRRAGTDFSNPAEKPVAAMIGGEVFNLNYTPKRECSIRLLRYGDDEGRRVYERTLQFVLIIAVRKLFPGARLVTRTGLQNRVSGVRASPPVLKSCIKLIQLFLYHAKPQLSPFQEMDNGNFGNFLIIPSYFYVDPTLP